MTLQERLEVAQQYQNLADQLVLDGANAAAGEMLWGAVHNVIQAIGIQHGLLGGADEIRRMAVMHHMINRHGYDVSLRVQLRTAGRLHGHFYNRNLPEDDLLGLMQATRQYIDALANIAEAVCPQ